MAGKTYSTPAPLVYNGEVINARDETLSLTDMWKASGADAARKPSEWLRQESATRFIEFLAESRGIAEVGKSHFGLVKVSKGGNNRGSTFAHWQVAMAYAKYLSPEFHMWCNDVVRAHMEGRSLQAQAFPPELVEMIRRNDGMTRMLAHKVTVIERTVESLATAVAALASIVQPRQPVLIRQGKTAGQILKAAGYPPVKGLAIWFGNRLAQFGCAVPDNAHAEAGLTRARLFDPDRASAYLDNGGRAAVEQKISERKGQGVFDFALRRRRSTALHLVL